MTQVPSIPVDPPYGTWCDGAATRIGEEVMGRSTTRVWGLPAAPRLARVVEQIVPGASSGPPATLGEFVGQAIAEMNGAAGVLRQRGASTDVVRDRLVLPVVAALLTIPALEELGSRAERAAVVLWAADAVETLNLDRDMLTERSRKLLPAGSTPLPASVLTKSGADRYSADPGNFTVVPDVTAHGLVASLPRPTGPVTQANAIPADPSYSTLCDGAASRIGEEVMGRSTTRVGGLAADPRFARVVEQVVPGASSGPSSTVGEFVGQAIAEMNGAVGVLRHMGTPNALIVERLVVPVVAALLTIPALEVGSRAEGAAVVLWATNVVETLNLDRDMLTARTRKLLPAGSAPLAASTLTRSGADRYSADPRNFTVVPDITAHALAASLPRPSGLEPLSGPIAALGGL